MPKISKHPYLKLHHNTWHFRYRLPKDVRHAFGGKHEYLKSLQTEDVREAERRKQQYLDLVVNRIKAVRTGDDDAFMKAALYWRKTLRETAGYDGIHDQSFEEALDEAVTSFVDGGWATVIEKAGASPDQYKAIKRSPGGKRAIEFMDIATNKKGPTDSYIDQWYAAYDVTTKTKDMARQEVEKFAKEFPTLDQITKKAVTQWIEKRLGEGAATSTVRRSITHIKQYWRYLQRHEEVAEKDNPFDGHRLKKNGGGQVEVRGFKPEEIGPVLALAVKKKDVALKNLILVAIYSGMRIEEICSMRVGDVTTDRLKVVDAKTKAGVREVPIHPKIKELVKGLKDGGKDGYLISGLSESKYGDRSSAIGKRFGRLKRELGYVTREVVFHSFRHTFTTLLYQADVRPVTIDALVGHETGRLSADTYSDGLLFEQKLDAVKKVDFPKDVTDLI